MLIDQFRKYQLHRGFREATIKRRRTTLTAFSSFLEPKPLDRATNVDIEEFLSLFPAPRTRHAYRSDLRTFYRWAVARDLLPNDPTVLVDPVKVPKSLPRPLGTEVHALFLVGSRRVRQMVGLGLYAGLRVSEIAAQDAADLARLQDPAHVVVRNGKGGKDRVIPMHPALLTLFDDAPRYGPLFPNRYGTPVTADAVYRSISRQLRLCGIRATPHQLRHTFGTEAARATGGNVLLVAQWMGHESMQTTKGYIGWSGESAELIARMFAPSARAAA